MHTARDRIEFLGDNRFSPGIFEVGRFRSMVRTKVKPPQELPGCGKCRGNCFDVGLIIGVKITRP